MPALSEPPLSLGSDLARALDPALLMRAAGMEPDPVQAQLLRSGADRILVNCCRQWGKSTVTAALALHEALYRPPALVLLLSPSQRQSGELFKKCTAFFTALGRPVPVTEESALRLTFANGSRIVSLPGEERTIRGYSGVRLLVIDEASRVEDALAFSVSPMLAVSGGRLVALTTPFGKRGWFHAAWETGGDPWQRFRVPAWECPRIPAPFLEQERAAIGDWWFDQEYGCQFRDSTDQIFSSASITAALSAAVQPLWETSL